MEVSWCGNSILKGTWQDSNNLLGSPPSALSTYVLLTILASNWAREIARPIYHPMCTCQICVYMYIRVWSSRAHRGETCQPASPELESGEIQAGKIHDWAIDLAFVSTYDTNTHRHLSFSLFICVRTWYKIEINVTRKATDYTFVVICPN